MNKELIWHPSTEMPRESEYIIGIWAYNNDIFDFCFGCAHPTEDGKWHLNNYTSSEIIKWIYIGDLIKNAVSNEITDSTEKPFY